jgi:hypothetical protein
MVKGEKCKYAIPIRKNIAGKEEKTTFSGFIHHAFGT